MHSVTAIVKGSDVGGVIMGHQRKQVLTLSTCMHIDKTGDDVIVDVM